MSGENVMSGATTNGWDIPCFSLTLQTGGEMNLTGSERQTINPEILGISKYSRDFRQIFSKEEDVAGFADPLVMWLSSSKAYNYDL